MHTLQDYIDKKYGTSKAFADAVGVSPQHLSKWKKVDYIVIKNAMYKKMRDLPKI